MDPKFLSNTDLLNAVRSLRGDERRLERKLIEYVAEIESRRLYAEIGYATVLDWLVKDLGYCESSARGVVQFMRKRFDEMIHSSAS